MLFNFTVEHEGNLLMLTPVTGSERGRLYRTSWRALHATVTPLIIHPNFPRFQRPLDGRYCGARPRNISRAAGIANVSCWRTKPVPMMALKAVVEPR